MKLIALLLVIFAVCILAICTACTLDNTPPPARILCYSQADQAAQARVDQECKGLEFAACTTHDDIMAELQKAQQACQ